LAAAANDPPDLILLDYVLPDMTGRRSLPAPDGQRGDGQRAIVYMSGFGSDLQPDQIKNANVIGSLNNRSLLIS